MAIGRPISLTGNVASKIIRVLATNGQTVFTVTGGYRVGQLGVFRNGVRLSASSDYSAQDGVTVTLTNSATLNDELVFDIQDDFRVADAIVSVASTQSVSGDFNVNGTLFGTSPSFEGTITQNGIGVATVFGDGSAMAGIVTTIVAGDNITIDQPNQTVTISGIGTADINADRAVVAGVTTSNEYDGYLMLDTSLF